MITVKDPAVIEQAAKDLIKSFGEPHQLLWFLTEAAHLTSMAIFENKDQVTVEDSREYINAIYRPLGLIDNLVAKWMRNRAKPIPAISEGIKDIIDADDLDELRDFVETTVLAFEHNQQNYNDPRSGYAHLQAFNNLIFQLIPIIKQ